MNVDALIWASTTDLGDGFRPVHRAALVALAVEADEDGRVWMTGSELAAELGCSVQTALGARSELIDRRVIRDTGRHHKRQGDCGPGTPIYQLRREGGGR